MAFDLLGLLKMKDKSIKRPSISGWNSSNLFKTQAVYSMIGLQYLWLLCQKDSKESRT